MRIDKFYYFIIYLFYYILFILFVLLYIIILLSESVKLLWHHSFWICRADKLSRKILYYFAIFAIVNKILITKNR